jgi:molybdopterin molybdotransferase
MSELLSYEAARAHLVALGQTLSVQANSHETLPSIDALGRVLANDLVATIAVPPVDNSAMDGYALRVADLTDMADVADVEMASVLPISQRIPAGTSPEPLLAGSVARIFTGASVPEGADAVVMQEHTTALARGVQINTPPTLGQNIRKAGEDIAPGQLVLRAGTRLGPVELGVAASVGAAQLTVRARLRVALFSTGDELVSPGEALRPGAIYNSNRSTLHALLLSLGCVVTDLGIVPDTLPATRDALRHAAANHDLILTSGGVSVGEEDHVKAAVSAEGGLSLWQLAIKPGKPLACGFVRRDAADATDASADTTFIGLPGNPVSSFVTFLLFVRPFLRAAQGQSVAEPERSHTRIADFDWPARDRLEPRREFLRVRIKADGQLERHPNQGSGVLTACEWADGLVDNPPNTRIGRGDAVRFIPFSELLR